MTPLEIQQLFVWMRALQSRVNELEAKETGPSDLLTGIVGGVAGNLITNALGIGIGPAGKQGDTGPQGPAGPIGPIGPPWPTTGRFFDETTTQEIFVNPTTGNDVTGNGLTTTTAYATVARALLDLPSGWRADVYVTLSAGTFTGNQVWTLSVLPGGKVTSTSTGRVIIRGDTSSTETIVPAVGVAVAGTLAQYDFNSGAYVTPVTDGSHYAWVSQASYGHAGRALLASASPNLRVVQTSNSALVTPKIAAWTTIFAGSITVNVPRFSRAPGLWFGLGGISFLALVTAQDIRIDTCKFAVGPTLTDVQISGGSTFVQGTCTLIGNVASLATVTTALWVSGALSFTGPSQSITGNVWLGSAGAGVPAKLMCGGSSGTITSGLTAAGIRALVQCDFRGTGNAIRCIGGYVNSGGTGAGVTIIVTGGAALIAINGARLYGGATWTWTGTGDASSTLGEGAALVTGGGFACTNSAAPGTDVTVGALAAQATAVRPTTDPTQLSRYT